MKATVTEDCIGCQRCVEVCPGVFQMGDEYAEVQVEPIPEDMLDSAREAADECPTSAILIEE